jgi:serine/threonine-protein phosphatase PGAM5
LLGEIIVAERVITLVRHGKYNTLQGVPGAGDLVQEGMEQAVYIASVLDYPFPITRLYSSTLLRAVTTANIIASYLPESILFEQDKSICEAVFHVPKHRNATLYRDITPAKVASHRVRMAYAYKRYVRPANDAFHEHDVLVCHGNVIRYFIMRAMRAPVELWARMEIYHGSITRLLVEPDGNVRLVTHNEVSHLPRRLWTLT